MTDLELTTLCADAVGHVIVGTHWSDRPIMVVGFGLYDPLYDNGQSLELLLYLLSSGVKIVIENNERGVRPVLVTNRTTVYEMFPLEQMRRSIVQCAATIQKAKHG